MHKLRLIIIREYITRVRKRSFIIGTLLAPLGLLIYMLVIVGLTKYQGSDELKVAVLDEAGIVQNLPDDNGVRYTLVKNQTLEQLKTAVGQKTYDGILRIPANMNLQQKKFTLLYYADNKLALEKSGAIERRIAGKIREHKIALKGLNQRDLEELDTDVSIDPEQIVDRGESGDASQYTAGVGLALGMIMAFIMFFMVLMYGQMVMRSVMEEKTNRIVEVMMSSVKPFELMMGKIIGAGLVGLTQVVAWVVLSGAVSLLLPLLIGTPTPTAPPMAGMEAANVNPEEAQNMVMMLMEELGKQNWAAIVGSFIVFFLGGYFIYASLFAAIGSAMSDDLGEGQALTLPVMIPIMLAFYIIAFVGVRNPDSNLMVFASLFPLFSPIVMPFRMAFNPPWWQVGLSLVLVLAAAVFFVWLAGRIYRVGILLYGKKVTFKELGKWLFYKV